VCSRTKGGGDDAGPAALGAGVGNGVGSEKNQQSASEKDTRDREGL